MIEDEESIPSIPLCTVAGPIPRWRETRYDSRSVGSWLPALACMRAFSPCVHSMAGEETPRQIVSESRCIPLEDRYVTVPHRAVRCVVIVRSCSPALSCK